MFRPKSSLADQVIVITGASSGIGLVTARLALEGGARVIAAARSIEIHAIAEALGESTAGEIQAIVADVSHENDVRRIAALAIERFGRIDTWVNNAGSSVYGRSLDVPIEDMRDVFETDFWGTVFGSRIAVEHLRDSGGTLINVGSVLSDRAVPLQGAYSAAKHAVKAFTDSLRMELEHDHIPVNVTLIKPAATDTPFFAHAKNHLAEGAPAAPPPVYAPDAVARAILGCAIRARREVAVGGAGRAQTVLARLVPGLADLLMAATLVSMQVRQEPHESRTLGHGEERGDHAGRVVPTSAYAMIRVGGLVSTLRERVVALMRSLRPERTAS